MSQPRRIVAAERHLDERHAALDQPAGQQAALAEEVAAVGVAHGGGLVVEVERLGRLAAHQAHGPLVGRLVADGRRPGVRADEAIVERVQACPARADRFGRDAVRRGQVGHRQSVVVLGLVGRIALRAIRRRTAARTASPRKPGL